MHNHGMYVSIKQMLYLQEQQYTTKMIVAQVAQELAGIVTVSHLEKLILLLQLVLQAQK